MDPLSFNFSVRTTFSRLSFQIIWPKNFCCQILIAYRRCLILTILLNISSLLMVVQGNLPAMSTCTEWGDCHIFPVPTHAVIVILKVVHFHDYSWLNTEAGHLVFTFFCWMNWGYHHFPSQKVFSLQAAIGGIFWILVDISPVCADIRLFIQTTPEVEYVPNAYFSSSLWLVTLKFQYLIYPTNANTDSPSTLLYKMPGWSARCEIPGVWCET